MKTLVTGGLGFIGSETVVKLIEAGHEAVIVDNLSNSKLAVLDRIEGITSVRPRFYKIDLCNLDAITDVMEKERPEAVIHFAGLKAVGESVEKPLMYYHNNLLSTMNLLDAMRKFDCHNIVFSSSATVYGVPEHVPLVETDPVGHATNPYGETKVMIEHILMDVQKSWPELNVALLRYFNPIGGHPSGLLGEDPNGIPNNLMPYIAKVAVGELDHLNVFGNDYPTHDGTGVRDYIHVVDLARGHVLACDYAAGRTGCEVINLGTGQGYSVLDLVNTFMRVNGVKIPYVIAPRRPGDIAENYADPTKAKELGWKAKFDVVDACRDAYNFQKKNPNGIE